MNFFKKEEESNKRLIDLTEQEFFLKQANQIKTLLATSGIMEKLEPIRSDKWLSRKEVAKEYGISTVTLDKWVKYNQIPKPIKKGGRVFFSRKELTEYNLKSKKR